MSLVEASLDEVFYPLEGEHASRSGVIPYAKDGGREFWLLGTLANSGRYSDFGGQCLLPLGETPYECLIRETDEESNGLLTESITEALNAAFEKDEIKHEFVPGVKVWKWINKNRPEDVGYLIFLELDDPTLLDIGRRFKGNEENTAIGWYDLDELKETISIKDFNTNIQKYLRKLSLFVA